MRARFRKRPDTFYGKIIALWTFGPYVHVELQFSDGISFSSHEEDGGTRFKKITYSPDKWDHIDIPIHSDLEKMVRSFCEQEKGWPYDWRGIGFSFLPIPIGWQHPDKWFCSEVCTAALQVAGYVRGHTPASVSPNKLYNLLVKELKG